jgi:hypothetical protein
MDGRVQDPVNTFLKKHFDATYVDVITEPGPNRILADGAPPELLESVLARIRISVEKHRSGGLAVVGHHDCAGNPAGPEEQTGHTKAAVARLREAFPGLPVLGLWVDADWVVTDLDLSGQP